MTSINWIPDDFFGLLAEEEAQGINKLAKAFEGMEVASFMGAWAIRDFRKALEAYQAAESRARVLAWEGVWLWD